MPNLKHTQLVACFRTVCFMFTRRIGVLSVTSALRVHSIKYSRIRTEACVESRPRLIRRFRPVIGLRYIKITTFLYPHAVIGINECTRNSIVFAVAGFKKKQNNFIQSVETVISDDVCVNIEKHACLAAVRCMTNWAEAYHTPLRPHLHFRNVSSRRMVCTLEGKNAQRCWMRTIYHLHRAPFFFFSSSDFLFPPTVFGSTCHLFFPSDRVLSLSPFCHAPLVAWKVHP